MMCYFWLQINELAAFLRMKICSCWSILIIGSLAILQYARANSLFKASQSVCVGPGTSCMT
ncbi:uncharacterized protein BDZ99DRAFT_127488 [Mytilinidion resinicola]|uniref:Uncharacterized protein n=1 Tax=Mytilinidion resinicola TaxID=574789 RepID=A0A6A6Z4G9_9PEZI|nr:uncharacterized protein BDZ99DRAFT_127488 [Mytilinidion resinicola]KAF2816041.1 hypothetical protein BDZ99DRAFT_127488 [Mytilinidion resinicola]